MGGCFTCFPRGSSGPGARGDRSWAGAALVARNQTVATAVAEGSAGAPYEAGLLALREGPLLAAAVRSLPSLPELLLVNATGLDHPRRAGLALHLGERLDLPTVGVTHRPLLAKGDWPDLVRGAHSPLSLSGCRVGWWLCTRNGARPLAIHAAWRTDPDTALAVVLRAGSGRVRTPEPLRHARRRARETRSEAEGPDRRRNRTLC
ncbi:MAG: endonuclease V [bacterium]|nr:endonuclease V [bacterium]